MIRLISFLFTISFVLLSYSSDTPQSYKLGIGDIVKKNQKKISVCAKQASKKDKKIKGRMTLSWLVDEKGKASDFSRNEDTIDNSELYHCLEKEISSWKFPRPPEDRAIDVEYEFLF